MNLLFIWNHVLGFVRLLSLFVFCILFLMWEYWCCYLDFQSYIYLIFTLTASGQVNTNDGELLDLSDPAPEPHPHPMDTCGLSQSCSRLNSCWRCFPLNVSVSLAECSSPPTQPCVCLQPVAMDTSVSSRLLHPGWSQKVNGAEWSSEVLFFAAHRHLGEGAGAIWMFFTPDSTHWA